MDGTIRSGRNDFHRQLRLPPTNHIRLGHPKLVPEVPHGRWVGAAEATRRSKQHPTVLIRRAQHVGENAERHAGNFEQPVVWRGVVREALTDPERVHVSPMVGAVVSERNTMSNSESVSQSAD